MGEVVVLEDYRESLKTLASRVYIRTWTGARFIDLNHFDWFMVPTVVSRSGEDLMYLKLEDTLACSSYRAERAPSWILPRYQEQFHFDMKLPVILYTT